MFNFFNTAETKAIIVDKLVNQYDQIIKDQSKLEEARLLNHPLIDLEDNQKRVETRVARENLNFNLGIERIIEENDLVDIVNLSKILKISQSVCRILHNNKPVGTGFLINGNVLVTNNHVISSEEECSNIKAEFFYELDEEGRILNPVQFRPEPEAFFFTSDIRKKPEDEFSGLDFTMVALEKINLRGKKIADIPCLELDGNIGKIIKGETCIIIQHPNGQPKKISLNNNSFFSENQDQIIYETDSLPGSSGSPVLALGTCEVVALHQTGVPKMDENGNPLTKYGTVANSETPDEDIDWVGNAGIRISRILEFLQKKNFDKPAHNTKKNEILARTNKAKRELDEVVENQPEISLTDVKNEAQKLKNSTSDSKLQNKSKYTGASEKFPFIILAKNSHENFENLEAELKLNYGNDFSLYLATPVSAKENEEELFVLNISSEGKNPNEFARELLSLKEIIHAEYDSEIYLNMEVTYDNDLKAFESSGSKDFNNEQHFLELYSQTSKYVKGKTKEQYRQWNWKAVNYNSSVTDIIGNSIKIVQFDTGYSHHPKNYGAFNLSEDFDFVDDDDNSREEEHHKITLADYGHGARTGSIIIGNLYSDAEENGNCGLLQQNGVKLIPYRVAQDVLILGRQAELAKAVDAAIATGAKVITTSMGLPPTMTTYNLAKKVYEKGIIWCCAAGNEVREVVAPAVHPGTIAVAASNPDDKEWKGSSRGKTVDITAPGMHVYVPKFLKENTGLFRYGMGYGHGTSYATPHVSSAAVLWLYKNREKLKNYQGYQIIEAFRTCLKSSARTQHSLPENFGAGILDIDKLLKTELPDSSDLINAYKDEDISRVAMTFRTVGESLKMLWNGILRGIKKGITKEESLIAEEYEMSDHAKKIIEQNSPTGYSAKESIINTNVNRTLETFNLIREKIVNS
ncbi:MULTISPECIES: S8 family serine peptidase [Chryseobacterium]|uniref:Serine protease n=1 Tax=Chryseobacterium taihuense TaxID=1141221 RepID=A0A4V6IDB5_9FLAO|nr:MULTISPECIES: S8 family serine peptidase [Chryseobacterium]QQV04150.1 S8 family serine peptidase [Chryseobacterium sp. FDAARGOS 1104]VFB02484.1 Subtilisin [Chryseobacterium taihuense]